MNSSLDIKGTSSAGWKVPSKMPPGANKTSSMGWNATFRRGKCTLSAGNLALLGRQRREGLATQLLSCVRRVEAVQSPQTPNHAAAVPGKDFDDGLAEKVGFEGLGVVFGVFRPLGDFEAIAVRVDLRSSCEIADLWSATRRAPTFPLGPGPSSRCQAAPSRVNLFRMFMEVKRSTTMPKPLPLSLHWAGRRLEVFVQGMAGRSMLPTTSGRHRGPGSTGSQCGPPAPAQSCGRRAPRSAPAPVGPGDARLDGVVVHGLDGAEVEQLNASWKRAASCAQCTPRP